MYRGKPMRKTLCVMAVSALCFIVFVLGDVQAIEPSRIGIRGGVGTDVNLGLAYGAGVNYLIDKQANALEVGVLLFGGSFDEESTEGMHTYEETTDIFVFGMMANYLIDYSRDDPGLYYIAGIGLGSINVEWEERSKTDVSLGPLLPGGGSMQSADGSSGGTVFNLGIGKLFNRSFDVRAEIPVIVTFASVGGASSVVPTLILTAGYRF